jgi:hypothetical protein
VTLRTNVKKLSLILALSLFLLLTINSANAAYTTDGLVLDFKLNESGTTGTIEDYSGYGNDGTNSGSSLHTLASVATYRTFHPVSSDYIQIAEPGASISDDTSYTIELVVKRVGTPSGLESIYSQVTERNAIIIDTSKCICFRTTSKSSVTDNLYSNKSLNDFFNNVIVTYDATTGTKTIYINNEPAGTKTIEGYGHVDKTGFISIGSHWMGNMQKLDGNISFIHQYNKVLSEAERKNNYNYSVDQGYNGGIAFSFDDAYISDWEAIQDDLALYHSNVTFYVSAWWDIQATHAENRVLAIHNNGHEIGSHSYNHVNLPSYMTTHGEAGLINDEIVPSITGPLEDINLLSTSLSYPGGQHNNDTDDLLLDYYFNSVRGA